MFILPKVKEYLAEGEVGSGLSFYNDQFGVSLPILFHEIGHNLGEILFCFLPAETYHYFE